MAHSTRSKTKPRQKSKPIAEQKQKSARSARTPKASKSLRASKSVRSARSVTSGAARAKAAEKTSARASKLALSAAAEGKGKAGRPKRRLPDEEGTDRVLPFSARERILMIAGEQFARNGYAATSVRELAETAEVNVGAISYHFEGKEQLYQETLRYVLRGAETFWASARFRQVVAARLGTRIAAEEALRKHIHEFVQLLFQQETAFTLMLRELMEPTAALVQVVAELIGPNSAILQDLVEQLRPDLKDTQQLRAYCGSIIGQCVHLRLARRLIAHLQQRKQLDAAFLRESADAIADFSLAALRAPTGSTGIGSTGIGSTAR